MKTTVQKLFTILLTLVVLQISYSQSKQKHKENIRKHTSISINHQGRDFDISKGYWSISQDKEGVFLQLSSGKNAAYTFNNDSFFISFMLTNSELEILKQPSNKSISRPSGTLHFEDKNTYTFEINNTFQTFLKKEGISSDKSYDYLKLFIGDIDRSYVSGIRKRGFLPTMRELGNLGIHNVNLNYIDDIVAVYKDIDLNMLKKFRIHNVTKGYIDELSKLGYNLEANMLKKFVIHDISSEYISELNNAGYNNLEANMLKKLAIHQVDGDYIRSLTQLDINKPTANELKKAKIHRVTANFIKRAKAKGHSSMDLSDYIKLKIHGI